VIPYSQTGLSTRAHGLSAGSDLSAPGVGTTDEICKTGAGQWPEKRIKPKADRRRKSVNEQRKQRAPTGSHGGADENQLGTELEAGPQI
jgi:hypothetical protein